MATKIILLAQDIKVGTEIVQFALASGAAIMEYGECDSPLAAKSKRKKAKRTHGQLYQIGKGVEFRSGSVREKGYNDLKQSKKTLRRVDWISALVDKGYVETQATSIVAGLLKANALILA
jgi:hypothetical protein